MTGLTTPRYVAIAPTEKVAVGQDKDEMKLGKSIVSPSYARDAAFASDRKKPPFEWSCVRCGVKNEFTFEMASAVYSSGKGDFATEELEYMRIFYGISIHWKSRDGGWAYFKRVACPSCDAAYVVYLGIAEPENSYLVVTIQGVTEEDRSAGQSAVLPLPSEGAR